MSKSKFSKRQIAGTLLLSSTAIGATASSTVSANKVMDFMKSTKDYLGSKADALWQGTKGTFSAAGNYAVSIMDKGGEILKSGVNKVGDLASNSYNKVAGSKFSEYVGKGASYVGNKASDAYNLVKDSKGGQWIGKGASYVGNKASNAYIGVKNSKGGQWVSDKAGYIYNLVKDSKVGNFVSDHAWGIAIIGLLMYGTYRAIKAGINYYSNKDFSEAKDNLVESIESFIEEIISKYKGGTTFDTLINNLKALKDSVLSGEKGDSNMESVKDTLSQIIDDELTLLFNKKIENNYKRYCDEYDKLNSNK